MEPWATSDQVWQGALIFSRIGAVLLMLPGIGESYVPPRIRLSFALLMSLLLAPLVYRSIGPVPSSVGALGGAVIHEILIGLMIGGVLRIFMGAMTTAGEIISLQTTLSFAQTTNPMGAGSSTAVATFLSMLGLTLIMATDLHHLFIGAIVKSYDIFPFTRAVPVNDAAALAVRAHRRLTKLSAAQPACCRRGVAKYARSTLSCVTWSPSRAMNLARTAATSSRLFLTGEEFGV